MGQRVLVVEDSQVIQRLIEVCLKPAGFQVDTREDGPAGLEAALSDPPDLLILDVGLPKMDGWEVLSRLRSELNTRNLKVLVLTAHAQEETRERADRGGADAFLTKPFRPNDLRRVVTQLVSGDGVDDPMTGSVANIA
ncbi:MAG: response regulator [Acidimicrobiia bacterium]